VTVGQGTWKIQIEFNRRWWSAYRLIGYENRLLAKEEFQRDTKKDAGENPGRAPGVTAFVRRSWPRASNSGRVVVGGSVEVSTAKPDENRSSRMPMRQAGSHGKS